MSFRSTTKLITQDNYEWKRRQWSGPLSGCKEKGSGQPTMNRSKQTVMAIKSIVLLLVG
jgi:hypothetical protein